MAEFQFLKIDKACDKTFNLYITEEKLEVIRSDLYDFQYINETLNIPDYIKIIGRDAFKLCPKIKNVKLPKDLEVIEEGAFKDTSVQNIIIPEGVKVISEECFANCKELQKVRIKSSEISIAARAFYNCINLTQVRIDGKVNKLGSHCFFNCNKLHTISSTLYNKQVLVLEDVETIEDSAFAECNNIKQVVVSDKLKSLKDNVFKECKKLKYLCSLEDFENYDDFIKKYPSGCLKFPKYFERLGMFVFYSCGNFHNIILPESIKMIFNYALGYGCNINTFRILNEDYDIPSGIFKKKDAFPLVKEITNNNYKENLHKVLSILALGNSPNRKYKEDWNAVIKRRSIPDIDILKDEDILDYLIKNKLITLKSVSSLIEKLSDNDIEIKARLLEYQNLNFSFDEIIKLTESKLDLHIPSPSENMRKIWTDQKLDDGNVILTSYKGTDLDVVVPHKLINKNITVIGASCFSPSTSKVKDIINTRKKIQSITIEEGIEKIWSKPDVKTNNYKIFCDGCISLKEVVFPSTLKYFNCRAFNDCPALNKVTFKGAIEKAEANLFDKKVHIKELVFEKQFSKNTSSLFAHIKQVETLSFGKDVSVIYKDMFKNYDNLKIVKYDNPNIKFEENALPKSYFVANFTPEFIQGDFFLLQDSNFTIKSIYALPSEKKEIWCNFMKMEVYNLITSNTERAVNILSSFLNENLLVEDDVTKLLNMISSSEPNGTQKEKIKLLNEYSCPIDENGCNFNSMDYFIRHLKSIRKIMIS